MNKKVSLVFMLLTFLSGASIATFVPVMSLFLTDVVKANAVQVGAYFTISAVAGIIISQVLAKFSDGCLSRNNLILFSGISGCLAALIFIFIPYYYVIVTLVVIFFSISSCGSPQVFAAGREFAITKYGNSVMFTTYMRVFFALAWVITPPIGYMIAIDCGFNSLFCLTCIVFLLIAILGKFAMPDTKNVGANSAENNEGTIDNNSLKELDNNEDKKAKEVDKVNDNVKVTQVNKQENSQKVSIIKNKDVIILFIAFTLLWTCNSLYLISMPIYITKELSLEPRLPGFMMATAACLEIPVMLSGGLISKKFGIKPLVVLSGLSGVIFYTAILFAPHSIASFILVQIFNALFIGLLAGLGMIYFQELLPSIPGQATTLFNNATNTGAIVSGALVAVVAQLGSYSHAFMVAIILTFIAFILLFFVRKV